MGFFEAEIDQCKKHPDHKQQQGVCPFCLREKLSQLDHAPTVVLSSLFNNNNSIRIATSANNSTSSSSPTPMGCRGHKPHRMLSSMSLKLSRGRRSQHDDDNNKMKKSKSIAFVSSKQSNNNVKKLKKSGFWSKFINSSNSKGNYSSNDTIIKREQVSNEHPRTISLRLF